MNPVIVVGSYNVDHVWRCETLPTAGTTTTGHYQIGPGGKGFNQAIAALHSGVPCTFICALGNDNAGALARSLAYSEGLTLQPHICAEPTGTAGIYVDARGRNTIVIGAGANAALSYTHIAQCQNEIVAASVVLAQLEIPAKTVESTLELARAHGVLTLLNPAPANAVTSALLQNADILIPNDAEFAYLATRYVGERMKTDDVATLGASQLHVLCRKLMAHGSVVITLGAAGVFVSHSENELHGDATPFYRLSAESVTVHDTTGAGDAFSGALAAAIAADSSASFSESVRFANRFAALSTEKHGAAMAMPNKADVELRFPP